MKSLRFRRILLMSNQSKAAAKVEFDPVMTLIKGTNDTGKSSLIKSLYFCLGATTRQHPDWEAEGVIGLLEFSIDDRVFFMLRNETQFGLFDGTRQLIGTYSSITNELAPKIAEMLDYRILVLDRQGKKISPPPAFIFLPFYVDQDQSWTRNWNSFLNLSQLSNWKRNISEYIVGIKPNKYYELKSDVELLKNRKGELNNELSIQSRILKKVQEKRTDIVLGYNIEEFENEISELLKEVNKANEKVEEYKHKLADLYSELDRLETQKKIVEYSKLELKADYDFATNKLKDAVVDCPTCGAHYDNNFSERFEIARDEDSCNYLLIELIEDISRKSQEITKFKRSLSDESESKNKLETLLNIHRENITLKEIIQAESVSATKRMLFDDIHSTEVELARLLGEIKVKTKDLAEIEDKERIQEILKFYRSTMKKYLFELGVVTLKEANYEDVWSEISEIGSDLPRALLAYYFAILATIFGMSDSPQLPIVVDSPNQNAQDPVSLQRMYKFLLDNRPKGSQVILGTEEINTISYPGSEVLLENKFKLLQPHLFPEVQIEMNHFLRESFELK